MKCEKCGHDPEKIRLLKAELNELSEKVKEADIEFETTKKLIDIVSEMDTSSTKNSQIYRKLSNERMAIELDALRLRVEMIRKISPHSANMLESALKEYEKSYRTLMEIRDQADDEKIGEMTVWHFLGFLMALNGVTQKVGEMVKVCSYSIRDTIKRIE